ncbi:hypothetical protein D3C77_571600 [compost metagenome]
MTLGNNTETLPEKTVMGGDDHLDPAQVSIAEEQVDDVRSVIGVDRIDDVIEYDEREIVLLSHRQEDGQTQRSQMPFAEHRKRIKE